MNRRKFIAGMGAAAVAAVLPGKSVDAKSDGVTPQALYSFFKEDWKKDFDVIIDADGMSTADYFVKLDGPFV
jgi:predicted small secreted protein